MNIENAVNVNYRFARNILPRAVVRESNSFYKKYISGGSDAFLEALSVAWLNSAKSIGLPIHENYDVDISVNISHVYDNGDFLLALSLPYTLSGCDLIALYIKEDSLSNFINGGSLSEEYDVSISYYMMYKTSHMDKYMLLGVDERLDLKNKGYVSALEKAIIDKIGKIETKKRVTQIR